MAAKLAALPTYKDSAQNYREASARMSGAAIRLSRVERTFAADWPVVARLLSQNEETGISSEQRWAFVLAWIVLDSLPWQNKRVAVFDKLQIRAVLAEIFSSLGMEGEKMWRAAALLRVLLLQANETDFHAFWNDGDVRWLAGVNESDGVTYVNKELFEELIDWLQLPALLEIAEQDSDPLEAVLEVEAAVEQARDAVTDAGYKLDAYLNSDSRFNPRDMEKDAEMLSE